MLTDMHHVKPIFDDDHNGPRPYRVEVDGEILRDDRGSARRFKDSFSAALAGAKEVDRRSGQFNGGVSGGEK